MEGYPLHLFARGYSGNGMTFGFLAARLLLDAILERASGDLGAVRVQPLPAILEVTGCNRVAWL